MAGGRDNLYSRLIAWLKVLLPLAALGIVAALFLTSRTIDPTAALTGAGIDVRELARDMRVRNPDYNTMTESVPSNIVAGLFRFTQRDFFQKSSDEAANVPLAKFGAVE